MIAPSPQLGLGGFSSFGLGRGSLSAGVIGGGGADPVGVTGYAKMQSFRAMAAPYRWAFDMIGDSNQNFNSYGHKTGISKQLLSKYTCFGTGLFRMGNATAYGGFYTVSAAVGSMKVSTDAPIELSSKSIGYAYLADAATSTITSANGYCAAMAQPYLNLSANLKFRLHYGTFPTGTPTAFVPRFRRSATPFTAITTSAPVLNPITGSYGISDYEYTVAAASRAGWEGIQMFTHTFNTAITGPLFIGAGSVENSDKNNGCATQVLIAEGGASGRRMLEILNTAGDAAITERYRQIRLTLTGAIKPIQTYINTGPNDQNEPSPSIGPNPQTPGDSPAAWEDNVRGIMLKLQSCWVSAGGSLNEMHFLLVAGHPISTPDAGKLISYRAKASEMARSISNVSAINVADLIPQAQFVSGGYYDAGGNIHLTTAGYDAVGTAIVNAMPPA